MYLNYGLNRTIINRIKSVLHCNSEHKSKQAEISFLISVAFPERIPNLTLNKFLSEAKP